MKFIIDRSTWRCGGNPFDNINVRGVDNINVRGVGHTVLLNKEGFMCCLGQICIQLGISKNRLSSQIQPDDLNIDIPYLTERRLHDSNVCNSQLTIEAMNINDNPNLSDSERELALINLFDHHGHTIEFIGQYFDKDKNNHEF